MKVNKNIRLTAFQFISDKPVFIGGSSIASGPFQVEEGQKATINLTAIGNPSVINYKWTKDETDQAKTFGLSSAEVTHEIKMVRLFSLVIFVTVLRNNKIKNIGK